MKPDINIKKKCVCKWTSKKGFGYLPIYVWIRETAVHEIHFASSLDLPVE